MLKLKEKKLLLMKQECALAEKEFKIEKLKEDIRRIEADCLIQKNSIQEVKEEIKELQNLKE